MAGGLSGLIAAAALTLLIHQGYGNVADSLSGLISAVALAFLILIPLLRV